MTEPTVIDSLVVTFGLDPKDFSTGRKKVEEDQKALKENTISTAKEMEARGAQAAQFFGKVKTEALGLFAVIVGAGGIEKFAANQVQAYTSIAISAKQAGVATQDFAAYGNVFARNGGNAEAARKQVVGLADALQEWRTFGRGDQDFLYAAQHVGIHTERGGDDAISAFEKFAAYARQHKDNPQDVRQWGVRLGYDPAQIDLALKGAKNFHDEMQKSLAIGPSKEQIQNLRDLGAAWANFSQSVTGEATQFLADTAPKLTDFLKNISAIDLSRFSDQAKTLDGTMHDLGDAFSGLGSGIGQAEEALASLGGGNSKALKDTLEILNDIGQILNHNIRAATALLHGDLKTAAAEAAAAGAATKDIFFPSKAVPTSSPQPPTPNRGVSLSAGDIAVAGLKQSEGFKANAYLDNDGRYRVGYGSDTTTDPTTGAVTKVTQATRGITSQQADVDLRRRINSEFLPKVMAEVGAAWSQLTPAAKASLLEVAYNYKGGLSKLPSLVAAAQTGDPGRISAAIAARAGDNGGINSTRRLREANAALGGNTTTVNIGKIDVVTQATDAPGIGKGIAQGLDGAIRQNSTAVQANSGLS